MVLLWFEEMISLAGKNIIKHLSGTRSGNKKIEDVMKSSKFIRSDWSYLELIEPMGWKDLSA